MYVTRRYLRIAPTSSTLTTFKSIYGKKKMKRSRFENETSTTKKSENAQTMKSPSLLGFRHRSNQISNQLHANILLSQTSRFLFNINIIISPIFSLLFVLFFIEETIERIYVHFFSWFLIWFSHDRILRRFVEIENGKLKFLLWMLIVKYIGRCEGAREVDGTIEPAKSSIDTFGMSEKLIQFINVVKPLSQKMMS